MSILRTLALTLLLIALLPWGAYSGRVQASLARVETPLTAIAAGSGSVAMPGPSKTVQMAWVKCRKGLAGSRCAPDPALLMAVSPQPQAGPGAGLEGTTVVLPEGVTPGPTPPPPRAV